MKKAIYTPNAPEPVGPYSQAIIIDKMLYCSGQIPLDPTTGEIVQGGIEAQTEQVLKNLHEVLQAAGSSFEQVVKTSVYLTDLADFPKMNAIYAQYFGGAIPPARSTIQVTALPKGANIEIDLIASL